jgi:hypothetical protein
LSSEGNPGSPSFNAATTAQNLFCDLTVMLLSTGAFIFMVIYLAIIVLARRAAR